MRRAKESDQWRRLAHKTPNIAVEKIYLNGSLESNIEPNKSIFAICGLNGAGKSTLMASIRRIFGFQVSNNDMTKLQDLLISFDINVENKKYVKENNPETLCRESNIRAVYTDYQKTIDIIDFFNQDNIDELLEQFEKSNFTPQQLSDISYLVGKDYSSVEVVVIEDDDVEYPWFNVVGNDTKYNTILMGIGEYHLFYIYWLVSLVENDTIMLIEEPETFISISSQMHLMNIFAKFANQKITFLITTHSPFIIKNLPYENICMIARKGNELISLRPEDKITTLKSLGMEIPKKGVFFVEDWIAKLFFEEILCMESWLLSEYDVEILKGESDITAALSFPKLERSMFTIVGIYDGDMEGRITELRNWNHLFLPTQTSIEAEFKSIANNKASALASLLNLDIYKTQYALSQLSGLDVHDWFLEFSKILHMSHAILVHNLFTLWIEEEENSKKVAGFLIGLKKSL